MSTLEALQQELIERRTQRLVNIVKIPSPVYTFVNKRIPIEVTKLSEQELLVALAWERQHKDCLQIN